jgi:hypothetical protein
MSQYVDKSDPLHGTHKGSLQALHSSPTPITLRAGFELDDGSLHICALIRRSLVRWINDQFLPTLDLSNLKKA